MINEFEANDVYTADDHEDTSAYAVYPENPRYKLTQYVDAAFAVDLKMRSVTGAITLLNGGPIDWAVIKESLVVDSTTNLETLAYSSCIKFLKYVELRLKYLHIQPSKPYTMYTNSTGGKLLACNPNKIGRVRYLSIKHHMVKCYIQIGEITLVYCVTEDMLADCCTKICDAAQKRNLGLRFYNDCVFEDGRFYKHPCYEHDCVVRIFKKEQA